MPQLKISDVQEQVETVEKTLLDTINSLVKQVEELKSQVNGVVVEKSTAPEGVDEAITRVDEDIKQLRKDVGGHVQVYNQHIIDQHGTNS